jgi:hypothetical protein
VAFFDLKDRFNFRKRVDGSAEDVSDRGSTSWRTSDRWRPRKRYAAAERPADSGALHGRLPAPRYATWSIHGLLRIYFVLLLRVRYWMWVQEYRRCHLSLRHVDGR